MAEELPDFFELFKSLVHQHMRALGYDDLRVMLVLMQHRNSRSGVAYPSVETIARLTFGVHSKSRVRDSLRRLEASGFILHRYEGGGRGNRKRWEITMPLVPETDAIDAPDETGASSPVNGGTSVHETGVGQSANGGTLGGETGASSTPRINESRMKESQSNSSRERCDTDSSKPDFDFDEELAADREDEESPFTKLLELGVSEPAAALAYTKSRLGRAMAQAILDNFDRRSSTGFRAVDHSSYLASCCRSPKPELLSAARRLRKVEAKQRSTTVKAEPAFETRTAKRARPTLDGSDPYEDPDTGVVSWDRAPVSKPRVPGEYFPDEDQDD